MKKILAPFDIKNPDKIIKGFLYPNVESGLPFSFLNISNGKEWELGLVVFTGKEITSRDVYSKIVDSGKMSKPVNNLLLILENYLEQIKAFKIGDIIKIIPSESGFQLVKISDVLSVRVKDGKI